MNFYIIMSHFIEYLYAILISFIIPIGSHNYHLIIKAFNFIHLNSTKYMAVKSKNEISIYFKMIHLFSNR